MESLPNPPVPSGATSLPRRAGGIARDLLGTLVPAILLALLINVFLAQSTIVLGQSMEPNLHQDQRLIMEKVGYRWHGPHRGDIVVLPDPTGGPLPLIKRVVGLSGERVTIADGRVFIDGVALDEPYLTQETPGGGRTWVIPPLHVFVLGDNRSNSKDSRYFGPVPIDTIIGHAIFRYWPLNKSGGLP